MGAEMRIRCCLTLIVLLTSQILSIAAVDQAKFQVPISHPVVAAEKLLPHLLPSTQRQVASVRSSPNSAVITLTPTGFEPATLTITAGTAVTWHNTTTVTHTLQSGSASGFFKVFLPLILKDGSRVNGQVPDTAPGSESFSATLLPGGTFVHLFTTVGEYAYFLATAPQLRGRVIVQEDHVVLPSNPADVALPLDLRTVTNLATATEFLYSGTNPIQTGVAPGTIQARRVAVLRGRVLTHSGAPLPGVTITILNHPEFGQTLSRADGMFDLAVNGGERLTVVYQKGGYLSAQRQVETPWQDYAWLEEIRLIPPDAAVTLIDLTATTPMQIARGSVISDADGVRQATLFFPQGVTATMAFSDGTKQPLNVLHVRATEYTVGAGGSESMPARLPSATGYTYAAEFNADEAVAADASEIAFSRPLPLYLENFLDFPVGSPVPVGSYNRDQDKWAASADGQVVKILSITSDMADLDIDGNGHPASAAALAALGITDTERRYLAHLYRPNQGLWRIPVAHFTSPWDFNWPFGPPPDAQSPNQSPPEQRKLLDDSCIQSGSIIECQNQVLGEAVGLTGTPFSLHYQSDRMAGFRVADTLKISLSGPHLPASLARIALEIDVAGRQVSQNFPASPNQHTVFAWDGKDAYGRIVQGRQPIAVRIGYVYHGVYLRPSERPDTQYDALFGHFSYYGTPATGDPARGEVTLWQLWHGSIGAWDALPQGLGGWSLDLQHAYDPIRRVLYYGDGRHRQAENLNSIITTVAGNGIPGVTRDGVPATATSLNRPYGNNLAVGPDGSIYIPDRDNHQIRRVRPDGIISTVAGTGVQGFSGDGAPAIAARLNYPESVALGPDGSLYIADVFNHCVRRVGTDGIITTVAGTTTPGFGGDGGLATQAQLNTPDSVILGTDGSLYISDNRNNRVRRVGPDGIISTVAGGGTPANGVGDGGPALQARLNLQWGLAFGPDGSLYIADTSNHRIRRVGPDGVIQTVAGTDQQGSGGDGGPATQAQLSFPSAVAVGPDGSLYIVDLGNNRMPRAESPWDRMAASTSPIPRTTESFG